MINDLLRSSTDTVSSADSPLEKAKQVIRNQKQQHFTHIGGSGFVSFNQNKRNTVANFDGDDFAVKKDANQSNTHQKRYSQLAGLISDKELENMRDKIKQTMKK